MRSETWFNDYVFSVTDFLSTKECDQYIQISEDIGYEEALVTFAQDTGRKATTEKQVGQVHMPQVRNNQRVMFKSCLLYTSPSPRDLSTSRMPSSA